LEILSFARADVIGGTQVGNKISPSPPPFFLAR
jgi:hypothetical protein